MPLSQVLLITALSAVAIVVAFAIGYRRGVKTNPETAPKLRRNLPLLAVAALVGLIGTGYVMHRFGLEAANQLSGPLILAVGLGMLVTGFVKGNPGLKKNGLIGAALGALLTFVTFG